MNLLGCLKGPDLFPQLLTQVLVVPLHQLALHIEVQALFQSALATNIQADLQSNAAVVTPTQICNDCVLWKHTSSFVQLHGSEHEEHVELQMAAASLLCNLRCIDTAGEA